MVGQRRNSGNVRFGSRKHDGDRRAHDAQQAAYRDGRADKQLGVVLRQLARSMRTPEQQLDALDHRLGKGVGAHKERAKLAVAMAA